jgi:hypothetical protein
VAAEYRNLVYSAPLRYRMPPQDAADAFRQPGALRAWLPAVAFDKCRQWKLRRLRHADPREAASQREPVASEPLLPQLKEKVERAQSVGEAVIGLPERCQRVTALLFHRKPATPYAAVARGIDRVHSRHRPLETAR